MNNKRPSRRDEFEVAIVCALALEYDAVSLLFDQFWDQDGDSYGRAIGDVNTYATGRIGKFNVVLTLLPHIGKANAASAVAGMRSSYACLRLVLLVGICGGVPQLGQDEILLGDVVISKTVVQYDVQKQYPDNILRKISFEDNLSKPVKDIRNLLATLETELGLERLYERTAYFLRQLQKAHQGYDYPGTTEDKLFESTYRHKHRASRTCICSKRGKWEVCDLARDSSCHELQCDDRYLVIRTRLSQKKRLENANDARAQEPAIHFGVIASGDTVMKSGAHRDKISRDQNVIAFETEGAGAWEEMPCIIVKGVCNYADCHKNDKWLRFAAATSASVAKAVLERCCKTDKPSVANSECRISISGVLQETDFEILVARLRTKKKRLRIKNNRLMTRNNRLQVKNNSLQARNDCLQENTGYLRQQISDFMNVAGQLPRQILHDGFITIIDALNRRVYLHLDTICTKPAFIEVLKGRFGDLGLGKIEREEWLLEDQDTGKILDLREPWELLMRSGQTLCLSMIFWQRNVSSIKCPKCRLANVGEIQGQIRCSCGLTYRLIEEIQSIEILEDNFQAAPTPSVPGPSLHWRVNQPAYLRPGLPEPPNDDDIISHYQRVQVTNISFQIQGLDRSKIISGHAALSRQDLQDVQRLSAYLAAVYDLPKEECLGMLNDCETQLLATSEESKQGKFKREIFKSEERKKENLKKKKPKKGKQPTKGNPRKKILKNQTSKDQKSHKIYFGKSVVNTWQCCRCGTSGFLWDTTPQCTEHYCQHPRCGTCKVC